MSKDVKTIKYVPDKLSVDMFRLHTKHILQLFYLGKILGSNIRMLKIGILIFYI